MITTPVLQAGDEVWQTLTPAEKDELTSWLANHGFLANEVKAMEVRGNGDVTVTRFSLDPTGAKVYNAKSGRAETTSRTIMPTLPFPSWWRPNPGTAL